MSQQLRFMGVSFSYPTSPEEIFSEVTFTLGAGWSGIVGANGAGKSTLLRLARGELSPTAGVVERPGPGEYAQQLAEFPPKGCEEFMNDWEPPALELKERLNIEYEWLFRWETLSEGERKRLQLALVLWRDPPLLAVDEPTNHLDSHNRALIIEGLATYTGVGLLVSHDRPLLDALTLRTLVVHQGGIALRSGSFTSAQEQERKDRTELQRERREAERGHQRLMKEYRRRSGEAQKRSKGFSKAGLARGDSDGRAAVDGARITGKDKRAGELKRQFHKRLKGSRERLDELSVPPAVLTREAGFILGSNEARRDRLFTLPPGVLSLGEARSLAYPELTMAPGDRIHLAGPNGSGKSSLVRTIVRSLESDSLPTLYLPQELSPWQRATLADRFGTLSSVARGRVLATIHSLGSDPERIRETESWSPGEERKLHFALGALEEPVLLILDEPTNHLDLPALVALESALARMSGGILLVSHDRRFADAVTEKRWSIRVDQSEGAVLREDQ